MNINRRTFLNLSTLASSFSILKTAFPSLISSRSPNNRLRLGAIGCGGQGADDIKGLITHKQTDIVAYCDVDDLVLNRYRKRNPKANFYKDWREMLDKEKLDAVLVATPDHSHATIMSEVLKRGINLYAEKPLCRTLDENKKLEKLIAKSKVVTQLGTQIAAHDCDRYTSALISSGSIGYVKKVWLFSNTGIYLSCLNRNTKVVNTTPPKTLDWNNWLTGAEYHPYAPKVYHPRAWRVWRDFGSGWLGDMASHIFSPVWLGMNLGKSLPLSVKAEIFDNKWNEFKKKNFIPTISHVTWKFPACPMSNNKPFEFEWCDAPIKSKNPALKKFLPPEKFRELAKKSVLKNLPLQGRVVEGTEGILISTHFRTNPIVIKYGKSNGGIESIKSSSEALGETLMPKLPRVCSHYHEFLNCCINGGTPTSSLNWATKLNETIIRANMAILKI